MDVPAGSSNRIRLSAFATGAEKELPYDFTFDFADTTLSPFGSSKEVSDPNYDETDRVLAGVATWKRDMSERIDIEAEVSGLYGRIENDNGANAPGGDFQDTDLSNTRGIGALRSRVEPAPGLLLVGGAEYRGIRSTGRTSPRSSARSRTPPSSAASTRGRCTGSSMRNGEGASSRTRGSGWTITRATGRTGSRASRRGSAGTRPG